MNNLFPVQVEIKEALDAAPFTYNVYDAVPQGAVKPYIVIGEITAQPDEELGASTTDATINIHTWSAYAGKSQSHTMLQFIRSRLDNVVLDGTWFVAEDDVELFEDQSSTAAARLFHGIARYRLRVG